MLAMPVAAMLMAPYFSTSRRDRAAVLAFMESGAWKAETSWQQAAKEEASNQASKRVHVSGGGMGWMDLWNELSSSPSAERATMRGAENMLGAVSSAILPWGAEMSSLEVGSDRGG